MKKRILRSAGDLTLSALYLAVSLFSLVTEKDSLYLIMVSFGLVLFLFWGIAFYEISDGVIREKLCVFVRWEKIVLDECTEIGLVTRKTYSPRMKYRGRRWVYTHFFYFSENPLTEAQRNYEYLEKENIKMLRHNKNLHSYLEGTLGIEIKGQLTEKK